MVLYYYIIKSRKHYLDKFTPHRAVWYYPFKLFSSTFVPPSAQSIVPTTRRLQVAHSRLFFLFNEPTSLRLRVLSLTKSPTVAFFPVTKRALGSHVAPCAFLFAGTRATIRFDVLGPIAILARLACFLPELHVAMAHKPLLEFPAGAYEYEYHYEPAHVTPRTP